MESIHNFKLQTRTDNTMFFLGRCYQNLIDSGNDVKDLSSEQLLYNAGLLDDFYPSNYARLNTFLINNKTYLLGGRNWINKYFDKHDNTIDCPEFYIGRCYQYLLDHNHVKSTKKLTCKQIIQLAHYHKDKENVKRENVLSIVHGSKGGRKCQWKVGADSCVCNSTRMCYPDELVKKSLTMTLDKEIPDQLPVSLYTPF